MPWDPAGVGRTKQFTPDPVLPCCSSTECRNGILREEIPKNYKLRPGYACGTLFEELGSKLSVAVSHLSCSPISSVGMALVLRLGRSKRSRESLSMASAAPCQEEITHDGEGERGGREVLSNMSTGIYYLF